MSNWSRVVNTTTRRYIRDVENNLMRNRRLMALLKSKNRITYGWSGTEMEWPVEYKRNQLDGYADGDTLTFSRKERWKKAVLGWRGYSMTDSMSKMERLENSGTEAIIKVYSTIATNLVKDMEEAFSEELYINGYLAANAKRFHGIESIFGYTNTGFNVAQYVLAASQTYAGLNTQLNAYGGTWSGTWPTGRGTTEYDFWTPLIVNFGSTSFTASPNNDWAHSAHDAMRYGIIKSRRNKSLNGQLDVLMVDDEMFRIYLGVLDAKERIIVQRNAAGSGLVKLGFGDVANLDGTDISWEYGSPANVGYGWNFSEFEIRSLQEGLFEPDGPDYDIGTKSWRFSIDCLGNIVINPKFQLKLMSKTS
jgi:hypothetical protein